MIKQSLIHLFDRDLSKLKLEIESYSKEENLWKVDKQILNSGGNLCLHLVGNLNHFIGGVLANTGYMRDRNQEFNTKNIPKSVLVDSILGTKDIISKTFENVDESIFNEIYPIKVFSKEMTTGHFLFHLSTHLAYHLGQINYHRRLLDI